MAISVLGLITIRVVIEWEKGFGGERRAACRVSDWAENFFYRRVCAGSRESEEESHCWSGSKD